MIWIAREDLIGTLSIQNDSRSVLMAELKGSELGQRRHRERRFFERGYDAVGVIRYPIG